MPLAAAPAPPRPISPVRTAHRHGSPPDSLCRPVKPAKITSTKTHLANLDRFLLKQSPQPPQPIPIPAHDDNGAAQDPEPRTPRGGRGSALFRALNLPSLFPHPAEEMSPRSLVRLHRLLSDCPHPSPKSSIASRWRLYHGAADWTGLLDPLDENLRRELVRYGDLVGAAYHAFHSHPSAQPGRPRHVVLPDRAYSVTASLYATSSLDLPRWAASAAPPWMVQRSSWVGYVAVCDSDREVQRMGRRDIVIALRGTATCLEWAENFRAGLVPVEEGGAQHAPKVECGFWSLFRTRGKRVPSLAEAVVAEVKRLMDKYEGEELSVTVTGHSLGAALGLLVADELGAALGGARAPPVAVFSFGGPKVGNAAFADRVEARGVKALRVVEAHDVVTKVPGVLPMGMEGYAHVGQELRVDSRASPYLRADAGPGCCHDLEAYLHLVDGFMGSSCPFRANAKRSIARLLDQQRASVKRLYLSTASEIRAGARDPVSVLTRVHNCLPSPS